MVKREVKVYESELLDVYKRCGVKNFPIDCREIVTRLGFILASYADLAENHEEYKRFCLYSSDAFTLYGERNVICYNHKSNHKRIRFSLMHEVGHYILQTDDEDAADAFAASILAPIPIARRNIIVTADYVCKTFDVSVAMANRVVMACKGKRVYDKHEKALIRYFDSFDEKEPRKKEPIRRRVEHRDDFPDNWNDLMLAKHDFDLYFY